MLNEPSRARASLSPNELAIIGQRRPSWAGLVARAHASSSRLGAQVVCLVVKRALKSAGMSSGTGIVHSLRAGLITLAKEHGIDDADTMRGRPPFAAHDAQVRSPLA